jgi:hypothetical protein
MFLVCLLYYAVQRILNKKPFDVLKRVLNMMTYQHIINTSLESNNGNDDDVIVS